MHNIVLRTCYLLMSPYSTTLQLYSLGNFLWREEEFVKVSYRDYNTFLYILIFR